MPNNRTRSSRTRTNRPNNRTRTNRRNSNRPINRTRTNRRNSNRPTNRTRTNSSNSSRLSSRTKTNRRNSNRPSSRTKTNNSRPSSRASSSRHSTPKNSSVSSRPHGRGIDHKTGSQTTAHGSNVVATTATASLTTVTTATLVRTTGSSSTANPIWLLADFRASSTAAIGSLLLTRGQATGQTTGTKPTMFTLSTLTMDITCTTSDTLASALQSTSRYEALLARGRERLHSQRTADPRGMRKEAILQVRRFGY